MPDASAQLLPSPRSLELRDDALHAERLWFAREGPPAALVRAATDYLTDRLGVLPAQRSAGSSPNRRVVFQTGDVPADGYELSLGEHGVQLTAADPRGFLYAAVTLRQWLLLPIHGQFPGLQWQS